MKNIEIISWNVNGLRAVYYKGFIDWLVKYEPDILCLQEIRLKESELPIDIANIKGYHIYLNCAEKPGYSGTAIFTKERPLSIDFGIGVQEFDLEGRVITAHFPTFSIINCYVPNGRYDHSRLSFKMRFYNRLLEKCISHREQGRNVIFCGDLNVAHSEIDLYNPKANIRKTGFLKEERDFIDKYIENNFIDVYRNFYPNVPGKYTWWLAGGRSKKNNTGWRYDYFFVDKGIINKISSSDIYDEVNLSDHCPININLSIKNNIEHIVN